MNRVDSIKSVTDPKTRGEQIDSSVAFILDNSAFYDSLSNRPARVKAAAVEIVKCGMSGYHFMVIKAALNQYDQTGVINGDEPPYTHDELYN